MHTAPLILIMLFGSLSVLASDVNVDPQREDTFLQEEQSKGPQMDDRYLQQEQMQNPPRRVDEGLPQERTHDLQFYEDRNLQQERSLERI